MTKEEVIFCEKSYIGETNCTDCKYYGTDTCQSRVSHKMAIKALEQEYCEDCVSRTEVIGELNRLGRNAFKDDTDYDNFFAFVDGLPSVTPIKYIATVKFSKEDMQELVNEKMKDIVVEQKKGKWVKNIGGAKVCSICQTHMGLSNFKFCPNCGSQMSYE